MNDIVTQKVLMEVCNCSRKADLMKYLDRNRIPYHMGRGGIIWTTIQAINNPLIGHGDKSTISAKDLKFEE